MEAALIGIDGRAFAGSARDDERGFTLVELLVSMAVMAIIVGAVMSVLFRAYSTTNIVSSRVGAQNDGRTAMERMSKQIRQATDLVTVSDDQLVFDTYIDAVPTRVEWRTTSGGALQERRGTGNYVTQASGLVSPSIFGYDPPTYTTSDEITGVDIEMAIETNAAPFELKTTVDMRNR